jgi:hypothetical protein
MKHYIATLTITLALLLQFSELTPLRVQESKVASDLQDPQQQDQEQSPEKTLLALANLFLKYYAILRDNQLSDVQTAYLEARLNDIQTEIIKLVKQNKSLAKYNPIDDYEDDPGYLNQIVQSTHKKPFKWGRK